MRTLILITSLFLIAGLSTYAQDSGAACREVNVLGPISITKAGDTMVFTTTVSGYAKPDEVKYEWTVSAGMIESGQGTSRITVRTNLKMANSNVTATVHIPNIAAECNKSAWDTAGIAPLPSGPNWLDEFSDYSKDNLRARVDNWYIGMTNGPDSEGIAIVKFTSRDSRSARVKHLKNILETISWLKRDLKKVSFLILEGENAGTSLGIVTPEADLIALGIDRSKLVKGEELNQKLGTLFRK